MSDIADVVVAFANRVKAGMPAGDALSSRVFPFAPDGMITPFAVALPGPGDFLTYDSTMDGADDFVLMLKVIIGNEVTRAGQAQLLAYMDRTGTTSIRAAVYGDRTLSGTVSDLNVTGWQNYNDVEWAGVQYLGAEMLVTVWT